MKSKLELHVAAIEQLNISLYSWLRWLVLLNAGLFSLMAGQLLNKPLDPSLILWSKIALILTALCVLFGTVAIFGEVVVRRGLVREIEADLALPLHLRTSVTEYLAPLPKGFVFAELLCYFSFLLAIFCWCGLILSL